MTASFERSANPELWTFLESLAGGAILAGTIAAIEPFGVFVALDEGPAHPVFPGVGFITVPELSWRHLDAVTDVVQVGQRVRCEFLQFDTWNLEARLSLRATQPDPFQALAEHTVLGQELTGQVVKVVAQLGAVVEVADGVVGLIREPVGDLVESGEQVAVVVASIDRQARKLELRLR